MPNMYSPSTKMAEVVFPLQYKKLQLANFLLVSSVMDAQNW